VRRERGAEPLAHRRSGHRAAFRSTESAAVAPFQVSRSVFVDGNLSEAVEWCVEADAAGFAECVIHVQTMHRRVSAFHPSRTLADTNRPGLLVMAGGPLLSR
jgi:hypothetical protein